MVATASIKITLHVEITKKFVLAATNRKTRMSLIWLAGDDLILVAEQDGITGFITV